MRGTLSWILLCAMIVALFGMPVDAQATVVAAPLQAQSGSTDGTMRVWLSSIKNNATFDLTLTGSYNIGGVPIVGSSVRVEYIGGTIYLTQGGIRTDVGTSVTLTRQSGGVRIAQSLAPDNVYPGDIRFLYSGGTNYVICHVYIEDYLYGVLPYEMDNTFPLEALKAQAVAARTYSAAAKKGSSLYDVTDTIDHQVFRGVNYSKTRCIQAVDETKGIVMTYGGQYVSANYTASNGGQTELNSNAWGSSQTGYYQIKDDPFDLANPNSVSKSYLIYSAPSIGSSVSANAMIRDALARKRGGSASNYTINEITDVSVHSPKYSSSSKVYTQLRVAVRYNGMSTDTVDIAIFPTVESALGLSINSASNELFSVTKESKGFRVTSRRYGHGVGLSQRGAEQMTKSGYGYASILGFYFNGITLLRMNFTYNGTSSPGVVLPTPTATSGIFTEVQARVSLDNPNNRLNMRQLPNVSSAVVARLSHGETVTIIADAGTWYQVRYGALTGFVAKEFLVTQQVVNPGDTTSAYVTLQSGSLNMRQEPRATSNIVGRIPNGGVVTVLQKDATWSQIKYNSQTGYVMTQYLRMTEPIPTDEATIAVVSLANTNENLNMRMSPSTTSAIVTRLRHGTILNVHERNATWSKVSYQGMVGYVMNSYVRFQGTGTATVAPTAGPTAAPTDTWRAYVNLSGGTLNMRSQPNVNASVVLNIPNRAEVTVTQLGDSWCAITYGSYSGYVVRRYLTIGDKTTTYPTATPIPGGVTQAPSSTSAWVTTVSGGGVYLRGAPSEQGSALLTLPTGAEVKIIEADTQWSYVQYGTSTGYVASAFLTRTRPGTTQAPTQTASPTTAYGYVQTRSGGPVNMRSLPSTSAAILMQVPYGTSLQILSDGPQWSQVQIGSTVGYISSEYIVHSQPGAVATPAPSTIVVVNRGMVSVSNNRVSTTLLASASAQASSVATLMNLTEVDVLEYTGTDALWVKVRSGNAIGYAPRGDFSLRNSVAVVSLQGTSDASVTVRSQADDNASSVGTAREGTFVTVLFSDGIGWTQVTLPNGTSGYIRTALLRTL